MTDDGGLRARKKEQTRRLIADTAARLFGEHGYDQVTVVDVARAAEVATQTVYNYFPTKQDLVLDRDDEVRERLVALVRDRPAGTSPAAALRDAALAEVELTRTRTTAEAHGDLSALCATSATVRRLALESRDRQADALAAALVGTDPGLGPLTAKAHAAALVAIFQAVVDEVGRRALADATPDAIADDLVPAVGAAIDDLDRRWHA
ncbi:TetR/AcrR family transcriptional regulator [Actinomycetospora atypica]|uniref:TetR/AcrR family transcriptional regulator n=1 Tax=Actinomycetospora atypica TaxID=1290095 RepID=A0ABV9YN70_9PSEU